MGRPSPVTRWGLITAGLLIALIAGIIFGPELYAIFGDPARIKTDILALGPAAPVGLIALSAIQIVLAPIPGYLVQIAGGYLFGPWLGGVYGVIGMVVGAAAAFLVARHLGAPVLERLIPRRLITGWQRFRHLDSMLAWVIVLLLPVGDFCYFLAGLTAISLPRIVAATVLVRGPTVFIASFVGAEVGSLPAHVLWVLVAAAIVVTIAVLVYRERLEILIYEKLLIRVLQERDRNDEQP